MSCGFKISEYHNLILYGITSYYLLKGSFQGSKEGNWQRPMLEVRKTVDWEWRQLWLKIPEWFVPLLISAKPSDGLLSSTVSLSVLYQLKIK